MPELLESVINLLDLGEWFFPSTCIRGVRLSHYRLALAIYP